MVSGLFLLLAALVSFGVGGYVAGRLRERWDPSAHSDLVEFRDGTHGIVAWALAVVITGVVAAASVASLSSKTAPPATSSATTAGEPLIAYELDRLFRGDRRAVEGDITYARAEAGRILLAATGRQGITPDDRAYLARLVAARTGLAQPDAERRMEEAITAASTAVQKARRSAVILGFATAASLLAGAAAASLASVHSAFDDVRLAPQFESPPSTQSPSSTQAGRMAGVRRHKWPEPAVRIGTFPPRVVTARLSVADRVLDQFSADGAEENYLYCNPAPNGDKRHADL